MRRCPLPLLTFSLAILLACSDDTGADRGVARVIVRPEHPSVGVGQTLDLTATAYDEADNPLPDMIALWQVGDAGVATVSTSGVVTGVSVGSTTVSATIDAVAGSADLTVTEPTPPLASVTVEPAELRIAPGRMGRLVATLRDFDGEPFTGPIVTWTTDDPSVASVAADGVVTASAPGTTTVTATVEGLSTTATVTVDPLFAIVSLEILPALPTVTVANTVRLDLIAKDAQGRCAARPAGRVEHLVTRTGRRVRRRRGDRARDRRRNDSSGLRRPGGRGDGHGSPTTDRLDRSATGAGRIRRKMSRSSRCIPRA